MSLKHQTLNEALQGLVGEPVGSVEFVEDYIQFCWSGSAVTVFILPIVIVGGVEYRVASPGYRDMLYGLEGQILLNAAVLLNEAVNLSFSSGSLLKVSLRDEDYVGPEALLFTKIDNSTWVV